jgi:serine/threonine protein kinase
MPVPPSDPNGRQSSVNRAPSQGGDFPAEDANGLPLNSKLSTSSHPPAPEPPPPRSGSSGNHNGPAGFALGLPIAGLAAANTDDAPTVITNPRPPGQPAPTPLHITGDPPTVAGRRLGHYELIEAVGAGGMAAVLKARDLELGRIVALKILPPEAARDPESITRFRQEARAAALLDHENIARVYSCGEDQGLYFIAFEFVEGINLRVMIDRRGAIPAGECVRYMIQVAAGLAHAAQRGVVHRDIKPSNIIITPDGRAKIVDMGLARQLDAAPASGGVTQSGVTLGTFDYISPEQALDPRRADIRSDIYSLGCAFYHAATGRPPVPEGTAAQKLRAHANLNPLDPRQINPSVPDEFVLVLARMMAKDPDQRYQSPAELIAHLKGLAERLQLSSDVIGQDSMVLAVPAEQPVVPPAPSLRLGWVVAAAAVVVAVAAIALSGGNPGSHTNPPPWAAAKASPRAGEQPVGTGNGGARTPVQPIDEGVVRTARQFAARLADPEAGDLVKIPLAPGAVIDLTDLTSPVAFKGRELELVGSANSPAVLRVAGTPADGSAPGPGSLSLAGAGSVAVTGVRFEVVPPRGDEPRPPALAGLVLPDAGLVTLTDCVFASRSAGAVRVPRGKAVVRAERCVFATAGFGLWAADGCSVAVSDCGFGPHDAAIQVGDARAAAGPEAPLADSTVWLEKSSFLMEPGCAAVAAVSASGDRPHLSVSAGHCVFAAAGPTASFFPGPLGRPVVLRSGFAGDVRFTGERKNAYYGAVALAVADVTDPRCLTFEQCRAEKVAVTDPTAVQLAQAPWADPEPPATLSGPRPWPAFALKIRTEPDVFEQSSQEKVIGATFHNEKLRLPRQAYPDVNSWPPPEPPKSPAVPETRRLVWQPNPTDEPLPKDTYQDLRVLLKAARSGDEIWIRHNGPVSLDATIELEKPKGLPDAKSAEGEKPRSGPNGEFRLKFRAERGYTPVLAAPGGNKLDQTLFRLMSGEVSFEGIHFLLRANKPQNGQTVAAVTLVGGRGCSFAGCVFTLAEEDDSKATAVLVADPAKVMAMESGNRPVPDVRFERCVIRGKGRGVWVDASRAVRVELTESLTAVDGPVFYAQPGGKFVPGVLSSLKLRRVTAFAGGPLVELHGGKFGGMQASGLVPLEVHTDECLFAAVPSAGRALVELDGIDPAEVKTVIEEWRVQDGNRYANFDAAAVVMVARPGADGTAKEWNWDQWISFAGEKGGKPVGTVTFQNPPAFLKDLAACRPGDAVVKAVDFRDLPDARSTDAGFTEKLPTPEP